MELGWDKTFVTKKLLSAHFLSLWCPLGLRALSLKPPFPKRCQLSLRAGRLKLTKNSRPPQVKVSHFAPPFV